jgi:enoyl-CoA hydratase|tara:strand:- start:51 stop:830 length:780 start_codon:yes stop_codon:yes gene_type:complete
MSPDIKTVTYETRGHIAIITFNRPMQRNAVNNQLALELESAVAKLESDDHIRVGILRGAGSIFCAGMDLKAFAAGETEAALNYLKKFASLDADNRKKPMIAAVHGAALAGGFEVMLACDMVVAAHGTLFGLPEVMRGLVAGAGGAFRLGQRISPVKAKELLLTADVINADTAMSLGLINYNVPEEEVLNKALEIALRISKNAPLAVQASLQLANAAIGAGEANLWRLNEQIWPVISSTKDALEGSIAFAEKREPKWSGL